MSIILIPTLQSEEAFIILILLRGKEVEVTTGKDFQSRLKILASFAERIFTHSHLLVAT